MKPVLHKLALAACLATISIGGFARQSAAPAPAPDKPLETIYPAKGPVPLTITYLGERDKAHFPELHIVTRANVVGVNLAKGAVAVASVMLIGVGHMDGANKEHLYGNPVTDAPDRRNLASPFMTALPAALDKKLAEFVAENPELGAVSFKKPMTIVPAGWNLMYEELLADQEKEDRYVLRFAAFIGKVLEGDEDGIFRKARNNERKCNYVSPARKLAEWKANNYEALVGEQKLATQSCVDAIAQHLPQYLGFDARNKIKVAKENCKNTLNACVAEAEKVPEPTEGKLLCKAEYKECVSTDVKPLIDSTPIGMCKATVSACKKSVVDKARAVDPTAKPDRAELVACVTEYKTCVAAAR